MLRRLVPPTAHGLFFLLIAAVFLRGLIPAGYMPIFNGTYQITICTMNGPEKITLKQDQSPASPHEKATDHCPYQLHAMHAPTFDIAQSWLPALFHSQILTHQATENRLRHLAYLTGLGARGPPETM